VTTANGGVTEICKQNDLGFRILVWGCEIEGLPTPSKSARTRQAKDKQQNDCTNSCASDKAHQATTAERFANDMIAPIAERLEREKSALPAGVVAEWIRLGLNGMQVSPERGGAGASFFAKVAVAERRASGLRAAGGDGLLRRWCGERSNGLRRRHLADQCSAPFQWVSGVYSQSGCPRYFGSPAFSRRSCNTFRFSRSRYHSLVMKLVVVRLEFPAIASSASLRASSERSSAISAAAP